MDVANDKPAISIHAKCFANSNIKIVAKIPAKHPYIRSFKCWRSVHAGNMERILGQNNSQDCH